MIAKQSWLVGRTILCAESEGPAMTVAMSLITAGWEGRFFVRKAKGLTTQRQPALPNSRNSFSDSLNCAPRLLPK